MKLIAICDDEPQFLREMQEAILAYAQSRGLAYETHLFPDAQALLSCGLHFDVILLDILMPHGPNGMEAAKLLRKSGQDCPIIFTTASAEYVYDAFDVQAINYLLKPIDRQKLFDSLDRVLRQEEEGSLLVKQRFDYQKIPFSNIVYIEVVNRKVYLSLTNGNVVDYYEKLGELEHLLGGDFFRCHRSYIVNLGHVRALDGTFAVMDGGKRIPISRNKKQELAHRLLSHFKAR